MGIFAGQPIAYPHSPRPHPPLDSRCGGPIDSLLALQLLTLLSRVPSSSPSWWPGPLCVATRCPHPLSSPSPPSGAALSLVAPYAPCLPRPLVLGPLHSLKVSAVRPHLPFSHMFVLLLTHSPLTNNLFVAASSSGSILLFFCWSHSEDPLMAKVISGWSETTALD